MKSKRKWEREKHEKHERKHEAPEASEASEAWEKYVEVSWPWPPLSAGRESVISRQVADQQILHLGESEDDIIWIKVSALLWSKKNVV